MIPPYACHREMEHTRPHGLFPLPAILPHLVFCPLSSRLHRAVTFAAIYLSREDYIEKARGAAKKSRNPYLSVIWTEGGAQPAFEEATGLTFGFPALVAISIEKKVS